MPNEVQYWGLKNVASFALSSSDLQADGMVPLIHRSELLGCEGGRDISPQLSWSGAPHHTKSYAVTAYTPDAPTGSGMWHWAVAGIPASVTSLEQNAGVERSTALPRDAVQLSNDLGFRSYLGTGESSGSDYRYVFAVHALDVHELKLDPDTTPAHLGWHMIDHVIGRATLLVHSADATFYRDSLAYSTRDPGEGLITY